MTRKMCCLGFHYKQMQHFRSGEGGAIRTRGTPLSGGKNYQVGAKYQRGGANTRGK